MESKHKNALIGALLAVVFVMAVGYAAFAQQLTINGTAEIVSSWDVHFDPTYVGTSALANSVKPVNITTGFDGADINPTGSIEYLYDNHVANISATLIQPGDNIIFTLKPTNYGTIHATGTVSVSAYGGSTHNQGATQVTTITNQAWSGVNINEITTGKKWEATKGYIKFTVECNPSASLAQNDADTVTVKAEYVSPVENATDIVPTSAGISIGLNYQQAS